MLEHGVLVGDGNELVVAEALGVGDICKVWITSLAEFTNNKRFIEL